MIHHRRATLALSCLLAAAFATPDAQATEDDPGIWAVTATGGRLGGQDSRWRYSVDAQARYFDIGAGINQWLLRPGVGYDLGRNVSVWLGYGRFRTRGRSGAVVDENRYWQDLVWSPRLGSGHRLSLRARLEQRSVSAGDDVGIVLRAMARYTIPVRDSSRFFLGVEPFVDLNTTDWSGGTGLSQARLFAGFGWTLGKRMSVEAGYMQQYFKFETREDLINHLAVVALRF